MKKTPGLIMTFLLLCVYQIVTSQITDKGIEAFNSFRMQLSKNNLQYKDVDGSPYFKNEFIESEVIFKDQKVLNIQLRYNIYSDKMEYMEKGELYEIANPEIIEKIKYGDAIYIYLNEKEVKGYFELIANGNCILLQKKMIQLKPAEPAGPYKDPVPPKFEKRPDKFFVKVKENKFLEITSLKNTIEALDEHRDDIEYFIKQEKIKKIKRESLIKIINHYNSL